MEHPTEFDLNDAFRNWRAGLANSPAFRPDDLDQLEAHLRDSVATLQNQGLTAEEAFWLARRRVGTDANLNSEFGKVNADQVWLDRAMWMVVGLVFIGALSRFAADLGTLATIAIHSLTNGTRFLGPLSLLVHFTLFVGMLIVIWRSTRRADGWLRRAGEWLRIHPKSWVLVLFLLGVFKLVGGTMAQLLLARNLQQDVFVMILQRQSILNAILPLFWPLLLAWFLAKRQKLFAAW